MAEYIPITEDQQARANAVDLVEMLRSQGEQLKRSGSEWLWTRHKGVTVRGNEWYSNYDRRGGWAIDFMREFHGMTYPEAVCYLLGGEISPVPAEYEPPAKKQEKKKAFALPEAHGDMRRVFAYLMKTRFIDRDVITHFAHEKLLYEDKDFHNAVFVGCDENGIPRHAHKKGTWSDGPGFQANAEGSDPRYSFHHIGTSDTLHVFEAPVDMLSYITMHPQDWKRDSYVVLDGVAEHAMLWMLEQNPQITKIILRLDNDPPGIEADGRLSEILREHGYSDITIDKSVNKDWNEDVKEQNGVTPIPAEPHPKLAACAELGGELAELCCGMNPRNVRWEHILAGHQSLMGLTQYGRLMTPDREGRADELLRDMAARAVLRIVNERRQMESPVLSERIVDALIVGYEPHKDRDHFRAKIESVHQDCLAIDGLLHAVGMRTRADRDRLLDSYFRLAQDCLRTRICLSVDGQSQAQATEPCRSMTMA